MSKAKKIDANTWHYRGFTITADYHSTTSYRQCRTRQGFRIEDAPSPFGEFSQLRSQWVPSLVSAVERIDEWNERYDSRSFLEGSRIPLAIEKARRIACERGEPIDCPDQHLCRHGIDN